MTVRPLFFLCSWLLSALVHAWTERLFVVWLKSKSRHEKKLPSVEGEEEVVCGVEKEVVCACVCMYVCVCVCMCVYGCVCGCVEG